MRSAALILALTLAAQAPPRDGAPRLLPPGTGVVVGVTVADGPDAAPLPRVVVTINHTDKLYGDTTISDDAGRFEFRGVPAGRYAIGAQKDGFLRARYGATRPGRAGTPVAVADGQRLTDLRVPLIKGAVLTGTVRDEQGEPHEGARVLLKRVTTAGGERRLVEAWGDGESETDDRGVYRIFGLVPGDYVLQVIGHAGFAHHGGAAIRRTTTADLAWARAVQTGGQAGRPVDPAAPPPQTPRGLAPVYYPGVLQATAAGVITLGPGEERDGLDVRLLPVTASRVEGVVTGTDNDPGAAPPEIHLVESRSDASAFFTMQMAAGTRFVFDGVTPGQYTLVATTASPRRWAMSSVAVSGENVRVALALQPGLTISGRVVFDGAGSEAVDRRRLRLRMSALGAGGGLIIEPPVAQAQADGTFAIDGLMPGRYQLLAEPGPAGAGWTLASVTHEGRDLLGAPIEVSADSRLADVVVRFTDRPTEIAGQLQDATGRAAAADYFIVIFAADERSWFQRSPRIAQTRPGTDGRFTVRGLPPGDYLLAALTDVEPDEGFDPGFLRQLVPASIKVSLADGERKTQDVRIAR